jgi:excisionase family DNA binding protein
VVDARFPVPAIKELTLRALPPLLLDVREACDALRISRAKLYQEIAAGRLETVSIGARRLVPREALVDYVTALRAEQVPGR